MFNFFKEDNSNKIPDDYKHLMDQHAYESMLNTIVQYFKEKGEPVLKIENGFIVTIAEDENKQQHQYGLDNLIRAVAAAPKEDKEAVIYTHFNRLYYDMRPLEYFRKDYETAKQHLKILIKHDSILTQKGGKDVVYKVIFPGTCCVLVFDYDNKFTYLYNEMIKEWNKTTDELFEEALYNITREDINVFGLNINADEEHGSNKQPDDENAEAYVFMNGDFAASAIISIEHSAPFAIGKYGSIIAIPAKGAAIGAPINGRDVFKLLSPLSILVLKFFNENQGNITTNLYWYYENKFHLLPETPSKEKEGYMAVLLPHTLLQLLNEQ